MVRCYRFKRYRGPTQMAEDIGVHASSVEEAFEKATESNRPGYGTNKERDVREKLVFDGFHMCQTGCPICSEVE